MFVFATPINTNLPIRRIGSAAIILFGAASACAQPSQSPSNLQSGVLFEETITTFRFDPQVRIQINAPIKRRPNARTRLVVYALPNGNTIEMTAGRRMTDGLDWHYDIQHIAAQIRFLRDRVRQFDWVVAYVEAEGLSWPRWCSTHAPAGEKIFNLLQTIRKRVDPDAHIDLASHSGGGSLIFRIIESETNIPAWIDRIVFLDSTYNYADEKRHGDKLLDWLNDGDNRALCAVAYDDRDVRYKGKLIVGPTGGTYRKTRQMLARLEQHLAFEQSESQRFHRYRAINGRVDIILLNNPKLKILHTVMVEKNGLIHALTTGAPDEGVAEFFGSRAYERWIQEQ